MNLIAFMDGLRSRGFTEAQIISAIEAVSEAHDPDNLKVACGPCNGGKSGLTLEEWRAKICQ